MSESTGHGDAPMLVTRLHGAAGRQRRRAVLFALVRAIGSAVALLVLYYVIPIEARSRGELGLRLSIAFFLIVGVLAWQLRAVNRARFPQLRAIEALAVIVTTIVVAFSIAYVNMSDYDHGAFNELLGRTSSLYFTLTTTATVGYGDIHATTDAARIMVMFQMVANVVLLGASVRVIMRVARYRADTPHEVHRQNTHDGPS